MIVAQLKALEEKKIAEKKALQIEHNRILQQQMTYEEVRRLCAEVIKKEVQRRRSQMLNARGNNCGYSLTNHTGMPASMANVACVAIGGGEYVAVMDDGTCEHDGLPSAVFEVLQTQHFSNIAYIAMGPEGQYYIAKKNGRKFYNGPEEFKNLVKNPGSRVKHIAFGAWDSFYVAFENGSEQWSDDLPQAMIDVVQTEEVNSAWLGVSAYHGADVPYLVSYGRGGGYASDSLPGEVVEWIAKLARRRCLKQLLASGDDFFVRYS